MKRKKTNKTTRTVITVRWRCGEKVKLAGVLLARGEEETLRMWGDPIFIGSLILCGVHI